MEQPLVLMIRTDHSDLEKAKKWICFLRKFGHNICFRFTIPYYLCTKNINIALEILLILSI